MWHMALASCCSLRSPLKNRAESHPCNNTYIGNTGWEVVGVRMIDPPVAVQLVSTPGENVSTFSFASTLSGNEDVVGRDVSAIIVSNHSPFYERQADFESVEMQLCCALGKLFHFLFSEEQVQRKGFGDDTDMEDMDMKQPAKKQSREVSFSQVSIHSHDTDISCERAQKTNDTFRPLFDYGYPSSISQVSQLYVSIVVTSQCSLLSISFLFQLVRDLLSCGDGLSRGDSAFKSLKDMTDEVHLLFEEPKLLFERTNQSNHQLPIGERIFGRSVETAKIADAYYRVASTGKCEVIIIGGYSG
jgi:hypothetical protein